MKNLNILSLICHSFDWLSLKRGVIGTFYRYLETDINGLEQHVEAGRVGWWKQICL